MRFSTLQRNAKGVATVRRWQVPGKDMAASLRQLRDGRWPTRHRWEVFPGVYALDAEVLFLKSVFSDPGTNLVDFLKHSPRHRALSLFDTAIEMAEVEPSPDA